MLIELGDNMTLFLLELTFAVTYITIKYMKD